MRLCVSCAIQQLPTSLFLLYCTLLYFTFLTYSLLKEILLYSPKCQRDFVFSCFILSYPILKSLSVLPVLYQIPSLGLLNHWYYSHIIICVRIPFKAWRRMPPLPAVHQWEAIGSQRDRQKRCSNSRRSRRDPDTCVACGLWGCGIIGFKVTEVLLYSLLDDLPPQQQQPSSVSSSLLMIISNFRF